MQIINPKNSKAVGPYSPAIKVDKFIFTSGQIGIDTNGDLVDEAVEAQCQKALENLANVLKAAGVTVKDVIKTTIFLINVNDYAIVNEIYGKFLQGHKPARSTVAVAELPKGAKIEIEAVAIAKV
ncbi:MAG: Rid family detoxifying hydrolase [Candidatus Woesebacteria bacterium]|jgi:2-iminobutanoate/2-iminopropanoate deaminase